MKVYFITRFSIFDAQFKGFRLSSNNDHEHYEQQLFSEERLASKFDAFESITFPSIVGQTCKDWFWLIYTSDRMPVRYRERLHELADEYPTIRVLTVTDFEEFFEKDRNYDYGDAFATVRLDDDDGLNSSFVERLQQYTDNVGSIVSFTEGRRVKRAKQRTVLGARISERNYALGMVGIGLRIYNCGRHSDINARYNVIYDATPDMFLVNCSPFADTQRGFSLLDRVNVKLRRLVVLSLTRPNEALEECISPIRKLFRR